MEPFTRVSYKDIGVCPDLFAVKVGIIVWDRGAQDYYVVEDSVIWALEEIQNIVFPQPVCLQMIAEWGLLGRSCSTLVQC